MRDILNIGPLLEMDVNKELLKLRRKLKKIGWDSDVVTRMMHAACVRTVYERFLPHIQKERGDIWEFFRNRSRWI